jgi:hypothetical protein
VNHWNFMPLRQMPRRTMGSSGGMWGRFGIEPPGITRRRHFILQVRPEHVNESANRRNNDESTSHSNASSVQRLLFATTPRVAVCVGVDRVLDRV